MPSDALHDAILLLIHMPLQGNDGVRPTFAVLKSVQCLGYESCNVSSAQANSCTYPTCRSPADAP